uniref:Uncharacterized protein n=1 Tax=Pyrodinium bahamense TaxID=73915 RepID=A0A7S0ABF3_9DINO
MVLDEIALTTGSSSLVGTERAPFGCGAARAEVEHRPVEGSLADAARALYYTRRTAEDLAHTSAAPEKVQHYAADVAKYAHDLEFFARQLGLAVKMPIMVEPPYLPVDVAAVSPALVLLAPNALLAPCSGCHGRPGAGGASGHAHSLRKWRQRHSGDFL